MRKTFKFVIPLVLIFFLFQWCNSTGGEEQTGLNRLQEVLNTEGIKEAVIHEQPNVAVFHFEEGHQWQGKSKVEISYPDGYEPKLTELILEADIHVETKTANRQLPQWLVVIRLLFPLIFVAAIIVFVVFLVRRSSGGSGGMLSVNKSKAKDFTEERPKVTFSDVAGIDEAVEDMREIKEFLENPRKFNDLGARIPKGVLLVGPPGCGKTLLARAVAGETGVSFFATSGSEFTEMFVGVGGARVKDLFKRAREAAPAIVFIDEVDALGEKRGTNFGSNEYDKTLNQLLVEMDGFDQADNGVIVMAATNTPEMLDTALMRAGRFDRHITVGFPDALGRKRILKVHMRKKKIAQDVDLDTLTKQTAGLSGADLANLVNEAALLAARRGNKEITQSELQDSIDRVVAGPERKGHRISDEEKRRIAFHEAGHALVGYALKHADPVHKVTIIPRGMSLGHTRYLPDEERYLATKQSLLDRAAAALGGKAAEQLVLGDISTGAANDLQSATALVRKMVTEYGMSKKLGHVQWTSPANRGQWWGPREYSEKEAALIDEEITEIIDGCYNDAATILSENRNALCALAERLLENETVEAQELENIFAGVAKNAWIRDVKGIRQETP